jgi:hypothetical protein
VCIQAIAEVKSQLKGLVPTQVTDGNSMGLGQWLVQLRQQLQGQVAAAGLEPDVAVVATLLMQHLAMMLSDAGAVGGGCGGGYAGRSLGLAVCDSLQAALWLLHRQLAAVQQQQMGEGAVGCVVGQWVRDLGVHVSSVADEAAMQLIAMV